MKKPLSFVLIVCLALINTPAAWALETYPGEDGFTQAQTIHHDISAKIYSVKKTKSYVAVEVGFTNNTDKYVEFTPKEIYLNDATSYSQPPLAKENVLNAVSKSRSAARLLPLALGIGLGIAALATSRGDGDASFALSMAALSMGGVYILSEALHSQAENNRLVTIENNRIDDIKRLPPGITLGGFMYFPATKKPQSLTIIAKTKSGGYEKHEFDLIKVKESRKFDKRMAKKSKGTRGE